MKNQWLRRRMIDKIIRDLLEIRRLNAIIFDCDDYACANNSSQENLAGDSQENSESTRSLA
jgi:hypothetical protein